MENKFKLEWIINIGDLELGVIRGSSNMYSESNGYKDCNKSCDKCKYFLHRTLMTPNDNDKDFCLNPNVIEMYKNNDNDKELINSFCSPYLRD